ncbi:MAG TPA: ABC transporter permease [Terracidiphilus sp.]
MKIFDWLGFRLVSIFERSRIHAEMDEELRSHIAHRADDLERSGLSPAEAERRARIEFGGREKYKEEIHASMGGHFMETVWQDVRLSLRTLGKSPGFLAASVLTLALAICANAVVFSVLNAFLLRPLNVAHPNSLYQLQRANEASSYQSYPDYIDLRDRNRSFDNVMAFTADQVGLDTGEGDPSEVWIEEASGNYFDALGLEPYLGNFYHASDEHGANSAPYIVLSYEYWHAHFNADPSVVGREVRLNRHPFTILGVASPDFNGTLLFFNPAMFVPLVDHPALGTHDLTTRNDRWVFDVIGYLKPGLTPAQAVADLNQIGQSLEKAYPKDESAMAFTLTRPGLYGDYLGRPVKAFLAGLMLLTMLILLAACANLGGLFAARAAERSREVALRLALGSTRTRILRSLLTEAVMISLAGGAVGLAASVALLRALTAWRPFVSWPIHMAVNPDAKVYVVALLLALASGLLFGAVPVRQVLDTSPYEVVKAGSGGSRRHRLNAREILLALQIAICAVLVASSLVAVRGLVASQRAPFGFDIDHTMLAQADLGMAGYTGNRVPPMQKRLIEAMEAVPGVQAVALADGVPFDMGIGGAMVFPENASDLILAHAIAEPYLFRVSPGYFRAAGTRLLAGRDLSGQDSKDTPRVAVVNGVFARRLFGSADSAIGHLFKLKDGTRVEVVGIAEDGKYDNLTEEPQPAMFVPILQMPSAATTLVVRTGSSTGNAATLLGAAMRRALRKVDPAMPVIIETRATPLEVAMFGPRMATVSLGVLGLMGGLLSITGIFGMAAYSVSKRLKELGIRMAMGARRTEVLRAALGRPVKLLAVGSGAGVLLGILAGRVLASIVYQANAHDPLVLTGVVVAMALLGLVATWIPAQRALSVNPLVLLRED